MGDTPFSLEKSEVGPFFIANGNEYNYLIETGRYLTGSNPTLKIWSSLRAVGPTGRKLSQDSLLHIVAYYKYVVNC